MHTGGKGKKRRDSKYFLACPRHLLWLCRPCLYSLCLRCCLSYSKLLGMHEISLAEDLYPTPALPLSLTRAQALHLNSLWIANSSKLMLLFLWQDNCTTTAGVGGQARVCLLATSQWQLIWLKITFKTLDTVFALHILLFEPFLCWETVIRLTNS